MGQKKVTCRTCIPVAFFYKTIYVYKNSSNGIEKALGRINLNITVLVRLIRDNLYCSGRLALWCFCLHLFTIKVFRCFILKKKTCSDTMTVLPLVWSIAYNLVWHSEIHLSRMCNLFRSKYVFTKEWQEQHRELPINFTQLLQLLTFYHICFFLLSLSHDLYSFSEPFESCKLVTSAFSVFLHLYVHIKIALCIINTQFYILFCSFLLLHPLLSSQKCRYPNQETNTYSITL